MRAPLLALLAALVFLLPALPAPAAPAPDAGPGLLPDLRTVVPLHLDLHQAQKREVLRFSNGIANTGAGDWRLRPEFPVGDTSQPQRAIQEVLDAQGRVAQEQVVSQFEWHPAHNHWHIAAVALFEVRHALDDGQGGAMGAVLVNDRGQAQSQKTTFCLIDWYTLEGPARTKDRKYWDCAGAHQGVQPGWVDQYHHSLPDQGLDLTGAPAGRYYLRSVANPDGAFLEASLSNNAAWVGFELKRPANGNAKLALLGASPCDTPALCGVGAPNR